MIRRLNVGAIPDVKSIVAELLAKLFTIIEVVIPIRCEVQLFDCTFENDEIQVAFAAQAEEFFLAWRTNQALRLLALDRSGLPALADLKQVQFLELEWENQAEASGALDRGATIEGATTHLRKVEVAVVPGAKPDVIHSSGPEDGQRFAAADHPVGETGVDEPHMGIAHLESRRVPARRWGPQE